FLRTFALRGRARDCQQKSDKKERLPVRHQTKMSTSTEMTSALHIHSLCLERTFVLCQRKKHWNELAKTSEKESHLQPRRANLSGKKWSTFARGNTERARLNKRSPSVYQKRVVPVTIGRRQRGARGN